MNVGIYIWNLDGTWDLEKEPNEKAISATVADRNYILALKQEDYFGEPVFLYDTNKHKIETPPQ